MTSGTASDTSSGANEPASTTGEWTLVVPFKGGPHAKSRMRRNDSPGTIGPELQRELALGFLDDTVAAASAVPSVRRIIIVSSDPSAVVAKSKVRMLADPGHGLNAAVEAGIAYARLLDGDGPVAALTADLPCLKAVDLEYALHCAERHRLAVVPDRQGTGTTLIAALPGAGVRALFGDDSLRSHLLAGHRLLPIPADSTLRADVDTIGDLTAAAETGLGLHTSAALLKSGLFLQPAADTRPTPWQTENPSTQRKSCPVY
ncbi:2-phospho-L-lactate guanylyltransferase [Paenarthrobacter sp. NPDC092416]|uniref:2-phospho-L-lactate guanylyltransferase n=1 Tax=Paenarthrobacter sp. NPDC092416 TaxID=3364386 RepID=UPI0038039AF0